MLDIYSTHNRFKDGLTPFKNEDPHLKSLFKLTYKYNADWWRDMPYSPGIYILTGGRQIGKSTSCKLLISHCIERKKVSLKNIFYLPCDEVFDARELSKIIRYFLDGLSESLFLLIIDEITFVKDWDRVIKALADEGRFTSGICLLTGSDTLILKEASMRFPGRRGNSEKTDFHLYPLTFREYVTLVAPLDKPDNEKLSFYFNNYLHCGGYLRAINDYARYGKITESTYLTYEQWIRGDFLKKNKSEEYLMVLLRALLEVGVSQISYSSLTQKIGLFSKETVIDYCNILNRMDILINLKAFDQNKKLGFPRKDRKFHFFDPFIYRTIVHWLSSEGYTNQIDFEPLLVESTVASHCYRIGHTYYFKGDGEVDVIWLNQNKVQAIEVKWSKTMRQSDIKMVRHFKSGLILGKTSHEGKIENIQCIPVYQFLYHNV